MSSRPDRGLQTHEDFQLSSVAEAILPTAFGYWRAGAAGPVSYPDDAHARCAALTGASLWFRHRTRIIRTAVERFPPPEGPFADIGGGSGHVAAALQDQGLNVLVIEPSEEAAALAVARGVRQVICGRAERAGLKPSVLSGIGLFDVLEHIEDDVDFLRFLRTRLRSGGRLYVTVPAHAYLWSHADVRAGHVRRYSAAGLSRSASTAGFQVNYVTYCFWCLSPAIWALRSLPSRVSSARRISAGRTAVEHGVGVPLAAAAARLLLGPEIGCIRLGRRIPIGASSLLVATAL